MSKDAARHRIAVLALPGVVAFDLAIPAQIFGHADQRDFYAVRVCSVAPGSIPSTSGYDIGGGARSQPRWVGRTLSSCRAGTWSERLTRPCERWPGRMPVVHASSRSAPEHFCWPPPACWTDAVPRPTGCTLTTSLPRTRGSRWIRACSTSTKGASSPAQASPREWTSVCTCWRATVARRWRWQCRDGWSHRRTVTGDKHSSSPPRTRPTWFAYGHWPTGSESDCTSRWPSRTSHAQRRCHRVRCTGCSSMRSDAARTPG